MKEGIIPASGFAIGLSVSLLAFAVFVTWTCYVQPWDHASQPPAFDQSIALEMREIAADHAYLRRPLIAFTILGGISVMVCIGTAGVLGSWWFGRRTLALGWFAATIGGALINLALKDGIDRPRPPQEIRDAFVTENNGSYPSGHSMGSTIGLGMLAYAGWHYWRRRSARVLLVGGVVLVVLLVGLSRIFLRAHWFSDVVAGFTIGTCWLTACLTWIESRRQRHTTGVADT
jgi:membrane-associated phospholipid phosphatase